MAKQLNFLIPNTITSASFSSWTTGDDSHSRTIYGLGHSGSIRKERRAVTLPAPVSTSMSRVAPLACTDTQLEREARLQQVHDRLASKTTEERQARLQQM